MKLRCVQNSPNEWNDWSPNCICKSETVSIAKEKQANWIGRRQTFSMYFLSLKLILVNIQKKITINQALAKFCNHKHGIFISVLEDVTLSDSL